MHKFQFSAIYWPSFKWKNQSLPFFHFSHMVWKCNLHWKYFLIYEFDWWPHQHNHMTLSKNSFRSLHYTLSMWLKWWCHLSDNFVKGDHWSEFQLCNVMEVEIPRRVVWRLHIPPPLLYELCMLYVKRALCASEVHKFGNKADLHEYEKMLWWKNSLKLVPAMFWKLKIHQV